MQDGMVSSHLETKQTKAKQSKKTNNKQTGSPMKISESHWVTSPAAELRLLEYRCCQGWLWTPQFPQAVHLHLLSLGQFQVCLLVLCAQRSLTGRSMGCWRLCQESEDRQDFDFTQLVLRQQLSCWTQTVQKNQPALCRRCCWPWIWCRPRKMAGLTDLPASLGTTTYKCGGGHATEKLLGRTSQKTLLLELRSPRRNITRGLFRGKAKLCWSQSEFSAVLKESRPSFAFV